MGFSNVQARLALRVSNGNVDRAVEYIIKVDLPTHSESSIIQVYFKFKKLFFDE